MPKTPQTTESSDKSRNLSREIMKTAEIWFSRPLMPTWYSLWIYTTQESVKNLLTLYFEENHRPRALK